MFNGGMRILQGGKFLHGFLSGSFSSLVGSVVGGAKLSFAGSTAVGAALGGTAEALGGGKFANGAITGAYTTLFNHLMPHDPPSDPNMIEYSSEAGAYEAAYSLYEADGHEYAVWGWNHPDKGEIWVVDLLSKHSSKDQVDFRTEVWDEYHNNQSSSLNSIAHTHPSYGYREATSPDIGAAVNYNVNYHDVISSNRTIYRYVRRSTSSSPIPRMASIKRSVMRNGVWHNLYREDKILNY
jgi:hypothetical protein